METEDQSGVNENVEVFAMDKNDYSEGLAKTILPEEYEYHFQNLEVVNDIDAHGEVNMNVTVRVNVKTVDGLKDFLEEFYNSSGTNFNIKSGRPDRTGNSAKLYGYRKCIMQVKEKKLTTPKRKGLHQNCPAELTFKLENPKVPHPKDNEERKRKKVLESGYPLLMHINFVHNHEIYRQDHKRFRNVSEETKEVFVKMFEDDLTPSAAWEKHRKDIQENFPDDYHTKLGDRYICPDYFWAFNFYRKWIIDALGSYEGVDAYVKIVEFIDKYNEEHTKNDTSEKGELFAKVAQTENGETCIAICDPFQKRVHKMIPQSGDLMMMDATSNVDRSDTKIFHLMCPSTAGGLPLATLVTTREDTKTIKFGLELLKTILPSYAFYGRGPGLGPVLCLTDDSDSERNALSAAWSQITLLLCQFHLLQALWQWLWSGSHKIEMKDRAPLLQMFRKMVYSDTNELFEEAENELKENVLYHKYPAFMKHIEDDILPRHQEWSLVYRINEKLPTSSINTTNYVESSFRWTKEWQFNRHRAYNLLDLLHIVMDDSQYQARKCIDMANNVLTSRLKNRKSRYLSKKTNIDHTKIVKIDETTFLCPSETKKETFYTVDMALRLCECYMGRLKGPCKHKSVVSETQNIPSFDVVPTENPEMRALFMYLGEDFFLTRLL